MIFGDTIYSYHRKNILKLAADALIQSDRTLNEIADDLEYSNASNFIPAFKNKYKKTPLKYRESSLTKNASSK